MTTQNGRSGSLNPGKGAKPFFLADAGSADSDDGGVRGRNHGKTLVAVHVQRIAESQPTAWEGVTPEGHKVHIAYRFGEVVVDLRRPVTGQPGAGVWGTVARFNPGLIEDTVDEHNVHDPYVLRQMAERARISEIRRSNEADMRMAAERTNGSEDLDVLLNRHRLVIRDGQLLRWLNLRNQHLVRLIKLGLSGGIHPVEVSLLSDEKERERREPEEGARQRRRQ